MNHAPNFGSDEARPIKPLPKVILSISGGGYRGLFSAIILKNLIETVTKERFQDNIAVYSGTSVGGLIACGLAVDVDIALIAKNIEEHGPEIFPSFAKTKWVPGLQQVQTYGRRFRRLLKDRYDTAPLERAISATLGQDQDKLLSKIEKPLLVPAVCATNFKPELFSSMGFDSKACSNQKLIDVALATAAAPTYFPPKILNEKTMVDGGLVANAPELIAASKWHLRTGYPLNEIKILSIGTASPPINRLPTNTNPKGQARWLKNGLFDLTMAAQEKLIVEQCEAIFQKNYIRIDIEPKDEQADALALDKADANATKTLKMLAQNCWEKHKTQPWLDQFFPEG